MNLQNTHQLAIAELDSTHSKAMETAVNAADAAAWKSSQTMMEVDYLATEKSLLDESAQQSEEVLCVCVSSNFLQFFLSSFDCLSLFFLSTGTSSHIYSHG